MITVNYGITFHHLVDATANHNISQEHSVPHPLTSCPDVQGDCNEYSSPSESYGDDRNPLVQYDKTLIKMNSPYCDKKPDDQYIVQFRVSVWSLLFINFHADFQSSVYLMQMVYAALSHCLQLSLSMI